MFGSYPFGAALFGAAGGTPATPPVAADPFIEAVAIVDVTGFDAVSAMLERARGRVAYGAIIRPWRLGDR
ncbi:hypothetical protein [Shinella sp.]|uniref:hypothetical protein n=1 Tax=Shinella sp. TaxID=1870904 RepID=UPI0029A0F004|nr:hypothetical protein [Shinella sp.]MDX3973305.1 hypothetical protein [Shinella sp.]